MDIALFRRPFYFLRHGESGLNAQRIIAGSLDTELTERGQMQARDAASRLAGEPITAIYASSLKRTQQSAAPIAAQLKLPVTAIPELSERNWGALEGKPRDAPRPRGNPEGAETVEDFAQRVLDGLARIDSPVPLIVGHSGVYRVLCRTLGLEQKEGPVDNCLPLKIEPVAGGGWVVKPL